MKIAPAVGALALVGLLASSATASPLVSERSDRRFTNTTDRFDDSISLDLIDGLGLDIDEFITRDANGASARVRTDFRGDGEALVQVDAGTVRSFDRRDSALTVSVPRIDGIAASVTTGSTRDTSGLNVDLSTDSGRDREKSLVSIDLSTQDRDLDRSGGQLTLKVSLLEEVLDPGNESKDDCGLVNLDLGSRSERCPLLNLDGESGEGLLNLGGSDNGLLNLGSNSSGGLLNLGGNSCGGLLGLGGGNCDNHNRSGLLGGLIGG